MKERTKKLIVCWLYTIVMFNAFVGIFLFLTSIFWFADIMAAILGAIFFSKFSEELNIKWDKK